MDDIVELQVEVRPGLAGRVYPLLALQDAAGTCAAALQDGKAL